MKKDPLLRDFHLQIPKEIHIRFKKYSVEKERTMRDIMVEIIEKTLKEQGFHKTEDMKNAR